MPRGQALGITFQLPEQDKDSYTRREFSAMIDVALGGRAAEDMIYGRDDVTSGCSSDLQRATDVATRMIRVSHSSITIILSLSFYHQREGLTGRVTVSAIK
jgi:ATP-dependent Zn protease